jgi:hypothetical protein
LGQLRIVSGISSAFLVQTPSLCGFDSDSKVNLPEKSVLMSSLHRHFFDLFEASNFFRKILAEKNRSISENFWLHSYINIFTNTKENVNQKYIIR